MSSVDTFFARAHASNRLSAAARRSVCRVIAVSMGMYCVSASRLIAAEETAAEPDLEAIVVTANKRVQKLEDVGMSIQAISGESLKDQHVQSLADLAAVVPGLTYTPTAESSPVYTLRGVGFYESSLPNYPSVSMYVDEVPLSFPALTSHAAFDLDRVEVLKGPQGTLFGQNATAGAINLIAAKPTNTFEAGTEVGYGNYNRAEVSGFVSGPVADRLAMRLAIDAVHGDGWQQSYTRNDSNGAPQYVTGRFSVAWQATDTLHVGLTLNAWDDKTQPQAPQLVAILPQNAAHILPGLENYPFPPTNDARAADWTPSSRPSRDNNSYQVALREDWNVTPDLVATAISSYVSYSQNQVLERDGTTYRDDDITSDTGAIHSFTQEVRLANSSQFPDRWVIGANFERSNVTETQHADFQDISNFPVFLYTGDISSTIQELRNYAGFANLEYDVRPDLTLKGGVRYTVADRKARDCTSDPGDGSFAAVFQSLGQAIQDGYVPVAGFTPTGATVPPIGSGCASLDNVTSDGTPASLLPGAYNTNLNEHNISWHTGLDFRVDPTTLVYVNVSKGFKAGSIPLASAATFAQYQPVTQESVLDYETGVKFQTENRRITVNADIFYYDYTNKQLRAKIVDPIFGLLDALENVPKSTLKGAEVEVTYKPIAGLSLGFNGTYLDSRIEEFTNLSESGIPTNFAGSPLPYTPKFEANLTADYAWLVGAVTPFVGATLESRSDALANIGGSNGFVAPAGYRSSVPTADLFKIDAYTLLDLRAGVQIGAWRVGLWAKNALNRYYVTNIYTQYDTIVRFTGMPATYGVTVSYKW